MVSLAGGRDVERKRAAFPASVAVTMEISLRRRDAEVLGARIPLPVNGEIGRAVWTLVRVQGFDEHLSPRLTGAGGQIR